MEPEDQKGATTVGDLHKTDECQVQQTEPKRCANCSGDQEATDRSCPKRAEFIRMRQQASKQKPLVRKAEKSRPVIPAFTAADFSLMPGEGSDKPEKNSQAADDAKSSQGNTGPCAGEKQENTSRLAGVKPKADGEEVLYSSEELWRMFLVEL